MSQLQFLQRVLPARGFYIAVALRGEQRRQERFGTLPELIAWCNAASAAGWHAYYACASFRDWNHIKPRGHDNVEAINCLWLDIDSKDTHANARYENRMEAWTAGQQFCQQAKLPEPIAVSSGGGAYFLWPIATDLGLEQWRVVALALKAACESLDFAADPARTADASSILRLPGTINWKADREVEVECLAGPYELSAFDYLIKEYGHEQVRTRVNRKHSPIITAITNIYNNDPSNPEIIVRNCQQIARLLENPGAYSEPNHYAAIGTLCYATDGIAYYKTFLDSEFYALADQKAAQWQAQVSGPARCRHFEGLDPSGCSGCPHYGKDTHESLFSPFFLGRLHQKETQTIETNGSKMEEISATKDHLNGYAKPWLPKPFKWSETSQLVFATEDRNGNPLETLISEHPIYLDRLHRTEFGGACWFTFQQWLPQEGWRAITLPASAIFTSHVVSDLALQGGCVRDAKLFTQYCHDARDQWTRNKMMQPIYEQFGWKAENTRFLAGTTLYSANGQEPAICDDDIIEKSKYIKPAKDGSLRTWVSLVNRITSDRRPQVDIAILAGFAAPLMSLLEISEGGTILSLVNRSSGTGKSMTLKIIASMWGLWRGMNQARIDTHASKGLHMAIMGNLPIVFDEMANIFREQQPEVLRDFVEVFSGGRDKMRAKQFGGGLQQTPGSWCTFLITASNYSLTDLLETTGKFVDAPGLRILEWFVDYPERSDYRLGDEMEAALWVNSGLAGPHFVQHCMKPAVMDFIKKALKDWTAKIWEAGGFKPEHRFWVRGLAVMAVAGEIAASLGLIPFSPIETINWAIADLRERIQAGKVENVESPKRKMTGAITAFGEFINSHHRDTLIVSQSYVQGMKPLPPEVKPLGKLLIRYASVPGQLFIPFKEFKVWAVKEGYSFNEIMRELEESKVVLARKRLISLGAGTGIPSAPVPCIEFDMKHSSVSEITRELKEIKETST